MKLTTKGRYAVTAMLDLAIHDDAGPVALSDIAQRQGISLSYLEQLFARLRKRGLVRSVRGPGGGYQLGRETSDIAVSDVIWAVDEMVDATRCAGRENCQGEERCLTHDLWNDLSQQIREFLSGIDLAELVERRRVREVAARQDRMTVNAPAAPGTH
ncbi:MAG: Fe-S cluster assembly transcriptional regulator IscR [Gammaproteobacteria bacterium]|nr:Fe-S cluster assembly transcriptional regulator IscR [Gammaproteobacteria bacterium]MDH3413041.1 Fe-S cluster assembly transcriptional regulator IscR [Gammaproteobacteria bacterium]